MLYYRIDNIRPSFKLALNTFHTVCEQINSPRSLAASLMLQYGEWEEYLGLSIDASAYEDARNFSGDYLVTEMLRKNPYFPLELDRKQVALDAFEASEARCAETNQRLKSGDWPEFTHAFQRNLLKILGPLSSDDLNYIQANFAHGPGATTGVRGIGSVTSDKYDDVIHQTIDLYPFYKSIIGEQWWEHHRQPIEIVEGNRFTTVPKSAKTERGICVEPTLNMFVQKGIGKCLRRKLRRFGINLDRQSDVNRRLAKEAYSRELATIDLSAASDSLASSVIHYFFPERWYHLLWIARSHKCFYNGSYKELEKWSSMGNGYTFELETLVFFALCMTFVPRDEMHNVSVFGDDIIVPRKYASDLIDGLNFLGFTVNDSKSYLAGNFFESCGHDYFKGQFCRPFYLKERKDGIPYALQIANKLRLYSRSMLDEWACDDTYKPAYDYIKEFIPRLWRKPVPISLGDTGLISSYDEAKPVIRRPHSGIDGFLVKHIMCKPKYARKDTFGVLLANLTRLERSPSLQSLLDCLEPERAPFSKGLEPRRGFLGKPRPRM